MPAILLSLTPTELGVPVYKAMPGFLCGSWELNSGLHASAARALSHVR